MISSLQADAHHSQTTDKQGNALRYTHFPGIYFHSLCDYSGRWQPTGTEQRKANLRKMKKLSQINAVWADYLENVLTWKLMERGNRFPAKTEESVLRVCHEFQLANIS